MNKFKLLIPSILLVVLGMWGITVLPTNTFWAFIVIVLILSWMVIDEIKRVEKRAEDKFDSVGININLFYQKLPEHPFVKNRLIPYLKKHGYPEKEISKLKANEKKKLSELDKKYHFASKQYSDY